MARGSEERTADDPSPERVRFRKFKERPSCMYGSIENLELVQPARSGTHRFPPSGHEVQNRKHPDERSDDINQGLDDVGPDHGCQPSLKRIDQGQQRDDCYRTNFSRTQSDRYNDRNGIYAHSLGCGAGQQKDSRSHRPQFWSEASLNQLVGRVQLAAKILRQQQTTDDNAPQQISHRPLKKSEIRIVGQAGNTDNGQCAGFCRNDREADCPPGNFAVGEEIIAHGPLPLSKSQPEQRDPRKISRDDQQVDPIQSQAGPSVYVTNSIFETRMSGQG